MASRVMYMTTAGNSPSNHASIRPRIATLDLSSGEWRLRDISSTTSTADGTDGFDYNEYNGLAMSGGVGIAFWSAAVPAGGGGSWYYATGAVLTAGQSTGGQTLTVTNPGSSVGEPIIISLPGGGGNPIITISGTTQTYTTSGPIDKIIVNAANSATLTLDESNGNVEPLGGLVYNVTGGATPGLLKMVDSSGGGYATWRDEAKATSTTIAFNSGAVTYPSGAPVEFDTSTNGVVSFASGLNTISYNTGSGKGTLIVDSTASTSVSGTISFNSSSGSNSLILIGGSGGDTVTLDATYLNLNGLTINAPVTSLASVALNLDGGTNAVTVDLAHGDPFTANSSYTDGGLGSLTVLGTSGNNFLSVKDGRLRFGSTSSANTLAFTSDMQVHAELGDGNDTLAVDIGDVLFDAGNGDETVTITNDALPFDPSSVTLNLGTHPGSTHTLTVDGAHSTAHLPSAQNVDTVTVKNGGVVSFEQSSGTTVVGSFSAVGSSGTVSVAAGASVEIAGASTIRTLLVLGKVAFTQSGTWHANTVGVLNLNSGTNIAGRIDVGKQKLLITNSAESDIRSYLVKAAEPGTGTNGLDWQGTAGITCYLAISDPGTYGVGYADFGDNSTTGFGLSSGQVQIVPTVTADATLDGKVDIADLSQYNNHFHSGTNYVQADWNYDGNVDIADFSLWNNNAFSSFP